MSISFNAKQLEAVNHTDGPLLVLAGAGSGKTMVLAGRVNHLIEQGIHPENILAITFTNKASIEMKERFSSFIGKKKAKSVTTATFHSLCSAILSETNKQTMTIISSDERTAFIKRSLKACGLYNTTPTEASNILSFFKNELLTPDMLRTRTCSNPYINSESLFKLVDERVPSFFIEHAIKLYESYEQLLETNYFYDFDDLILKTVHRLHDDKTLLGELQKRFQYIMIDEYQDTNHAQYVLSKMLADQHKNIAVVGDDFQSIYAFRGSDIRNILNFEQDYPGTKVVKLEENYRCTPYILQAANEVIQNNKNQMKKQLFTNKEADEKIVVHHANNDDEEATFILNQIKTLSRKGVPYSSMAVLYRSHFLSKTCQNLFLKHSIPYSVFSEEPFYEKEHVKDFLYYLYLLCNKSNKNMFKQTINKPYRRIQPENVKELLTIDVTSFCLDPFQLDFLSLEEQIHLAEFFQLFDVDLTRSISDLLEHFYCKGGFLASYSEKEKGKEMSNDLEQLLKMGHFYEKHHPDNTLADFLKYLFAYFEKDKFLEKRAVKFLSIHSAKGLEFPYVFLMGVEDGYFPHKKNVEGVNLEEERRLFYVALTRAKDRLFISRSVKRKMYSRFVESPPSRFLSEFSSELYDESKSKPS